MQYDQYQTVFALSSLANWVGTRTGIAPALQSDYQRMLLDTLKSAPAQQKIGTWELVWGPQVWQGQHSDLSDNAMFVAKCADMPGFSTAVYVVAICATNPKSPYDWLVEDFDVASVVDFATYDPLASAAPTRASKPIPQDAAVISMGTALGVWHLLTMVSPDTAMAPKTTLCSFLQSNASNDATVIFVGHSLGGALSPTTAAWLKQAGKLDGYNAVYCYPTAGATPGNAAFASLYAQLLPPTPANGYQAWNRDMWNTLDAVPHAWVIAMLRQIKTLYDNKPISDVDLAVNAAIVQAWASGVAYTQIANQPLAGTPNGSPPTDLKTFLQQVAFQHTKAYEALIANWLQPVFPPGATPQTLPLDADALLDALVARIEAKGAEWEKLEADAIAALARAETSA